MTGLVDSVPVPVPVRDAATVVLLRDGSVGVEAWLLTRVAGMAFAAGMSVFPGGRVEADDASLPFTGPVGAGFGGPEPLERALVGAAVRETFEETGVLLSSSGVDLAASRADVEAGRLGFGAVLASAGVSLDPSLLVPWGRWVTPVGEVRRYDTRFFVAALPSGAQAADVTSESSVATWVPVADALAQGERGERRLLPPTALTLASLLPFDSVAAAMAGSAGRDLAPVRPRFVRVGDALAVSLPTGETVTMPGGGA